ncbi:MAG: hypothetical protein J2P56_07295, partial [Verrucomicrobia bacterium]|nr:hypothetical protein [Verrucomicrobiota bacterium]
LQVVPLQHIEFALVRPIFGSAHITVANRIIHHIVPVLCVGLGAAQLPIPILPLPNRHLCAMSPFSRHLISPALDPVF